MLRLVLGLQLDGYCEQHYQVRSYFYNRDFLHMKIEARVPQY